MTCIAGIAQGGKVYIGGDSITSNGWSKASTARRKVFRHGELLIGVCGSVRTSNLLQHSLSVRAPEEGEEVECYIVTGVIDSSRNLLKAGGVARVEHNVEAGDDMLIGFRGQLFRIASDFQVDAYIEGIAAVGAAEDYALATMIALPDLQPEDRIRRALEVSAELCVFVSPPFYVEVL